MVKDVKGARCLGMSITMLRRLLNATLILDVALVQKIASVRSASSAVAYGNDQFNCCENY